MSLILGFSIKFCGIYRNHSEFRLVELTSLKIECLERYTRVEKWVKIVLCQKKN